MMTFFNVPFKLIEHLGEKVVNTAGKMLIELKLCKVFSLQILKGRYD